MEIEDVHDVESLFDFVVERTNDDGVVARFTQVLNATMIQYHGKFVKRVLTSRGALEVPEAFQQPGDPDLWDSCEAIIHISETENPGFQFALDKRGMIQYCVVRNPGEPIDRLGAPPGTMIH